MFKEEPDSHYNFHIYITNINKGGDYYDSWLEFEPELDELGVFKQEDMWLTELYSDRITFKKELERRGFNVVLGEDY